jgi:hypothetical protein
MPRCAAWPLLSAASTSGGLSQGTCSSSRRRFPAPYRIELGPELLGPLRLVLLGAALQFTVHGCGALAQLAVRQPGQVSFSHG